VLQVAQRGSRRITAYVFRPLGSSGDSFYSEIHLDLQACQAQITFKIGDRWGGGPTILPANQGTLQADTYSELCEIVSLTFNGAYSAHLAWNRLIQILKSKRVQCAMVLGTSGSVGRVVTSAVHATDLAATRIQFEWLAY
jgi:hypothetical protein